VALGKCGHEKKEGPQVFSKESAGEASNLMWRPVRQGSRDATTSACVGWDLSNIENQPAFRKHVAGYGHFTKVSQNGFTTTRITLPIINTVGTSLITR
jgi:hypothetical protein